MRAGVSALLVAAVAILSAFFLLLAPIVNLGVRQASQQVMDSECPPRLSFCYYGAPSDSGRMYGSVSYLLFGVGEYYFASSHFHGFFFAS